MRPNEWSHLMSDTFNVIIIRSLTGEAFYTGRTTILSHFTCTFPLAKCQGLAILGRFSKGYDNATKN